MTNFKLGQMVRYLPTGIAYAITRIDKDGSCLLSSPCFWVSPKDITLLEEDTLIKVNLADYNQKTQYPTAIVENANYSLWLRHPIGDEYYNLKLCHKGEYNEYGIADIKVYPSTIPEQQKLLSHYGFDVTWEVKPEFNHRTGECMIIEWDYQYPNYDMFLQYYGLEGNYRGSLPEYADRIEFDYYGWGYHEKYDERVAVIGIGNDRWLVKLDGIDIK